MKILLDTNALIAAEPTAVSDVESSTGALATLVQLALGGKHSLLVHPGTIEELQHDKAPDRRRMRALLSKKYLPLKKPPASSERLEQIIGLAQPRSHDSIDLALLVCVDMDAVDFLVTSDRGLLRKAQRAGLRNRVLTPEEAVQALSSLIPTAWPPPPAVQERVAYQLNDGDPIFASLRADYPGFDEWLQKCKREHRKVLLVDGAGGEYDGICILKDEDHSEHGLTGSLLKLCTFKMADRAFGRGVSELLLRAVLLDAHSRGRNVVYVECLPKYQQVATFLEDFGFEELPDRRTARGESVLAKWFCPTAEETFAPDPLAFHVRFGPPSLRMFDAPAYVVPIKPSFHELLFPDLQAEAELFPGTHPAGNAIRKAYLCHSPTLTLAPGSILLFYRSHDWRAVTSVGVLEQTLRSSDPDQLVRFVGSRTVYPLDEIDRMCVSPVLALRFRYALGLQGPWDLGQLLKVGVLRGAPQSITTVPEGGLEWLREQLNR